MAGKKFSRAARRRDISHRNYWGAKHFVSSCIDCMANEKKKKYRVWGVAVEGRKKKKFLSHRPSCVPQLPDRAATARALVAFHFSTSVRPVRLSRFRPAPHWSWPHRGRGLCDFRALVTIGVRNISTGVRLLKGKCPAPQ